MRATPHQTGPGPPKLLASSVDAFRTKRGGGNPAPNSSANARPIRYKTSTNKETLKFRLFCWVLDIFGGPKYLIGATMFGKDRLYCDASTKRGRRDGLFSRLPIQPGL